MPASRNLWPPIALSKGRLEGLSDGVFAIVMTLLVLDLKVPDLPRHVAESELLAKLRELGPDFFSYVITFILAAVFWLLHHLLFHSLKHVTRAIVWLNTAFLMLVSLLPFSTGMLGHFFVNQRIAVVFYFGNQFVLAALLRAMSGYAGRSGLILEDSDPARRSAVAGRLTVLMAGHLAGLTCAWFEPRQSSNAFLAAMVLAGLILRAINRRRSRLAA